MVDFKKQLKAHASQAVIDPVKLYDTLDRAVDKGPLRPAQEAVLTKWHHSHRKDSELIVKLHTGQGKTLIGLLMLQSSLNEKKGPALYLCADTFLVEQTRVQAAQFGIATCTAEPDLPDEFLTGQQILVTSVHKLFNGLTRFGLRNKSLNVGTILMDDAHACAESIRRASLVQLERAEPAYEALLTLFSKDLLEQGAGTYADILNHKYDAVLPVPYWSWIDHETDVTTLLSHNSDRNAIKFAWPLIKDILGACQCAVSGESIEIEPRLHPLELFGSYWKAERKIFMSATINDDSFLAKGLRLSPETIAHPLTFEKERWSGEKMILLPSLMSDSLTRSEVVGLLAKPASDRKFGIVALTPSFKVSKDWESYGSAVATKDTLSATLESLRQGDFTKTVVLANRYDGIDLPDSMCRVLILDSCPHSERVVDRLQEQCRAASESQLLRTIRTIEQGMGRSVRGDKDYSVIVVIGTDLVRLLRDPRSRRYLSSQLDTQVKIGLQVTEMTRDEIQKGEDPRKSFIGTARQCLQRDSDWKAFYSEQMKQVVPNQANARILNLYSSELEAEQKAANGDYQGAVKAIQGALDAKLAPQEDRAWYLQEMARLSYPTDKIESMRLQRAAFAASRLLLKPQGGVAVSQLTIVSHGRIQRIIDWTKQFRTKEELKVAISDISASLSFGVTADRFERALNELSRAIGFVGERPDKEWKEGPDNLWALEDDKYIVWECKSEVDVARSEINKDESDQMNRSCAWFHKYYAGKQSRNLIVIPASKLAGAAAFMHPVMAVTASDLGKIVKAVRSFFAEFEAMNLNDLGATHLQKLIDVHKLRVDDFLRDYAKTIRVRK